MRNLKKVLALVLVIALVVSLGINAAAFTDDKDASAGTLAKANFISTAAGGLGIINGYTDGSFGFTQAIQRDEYAKMMAIAFSGKSFNPVPFVRPQVYTDVDPDTQWAAGYVNFLASKGMINGTGNGKFSPTETITVAQALKMAASILGYDYNSDKVRNVAYKNSWQAWAAAMGHAAGLTAGFTANLEDPCTRDIAVNIIYNALFANMVNYNTVTEQYQSKGFTLGSSAFNYNQITGYVVATPTVALPYRTPKATVAVGYSDGDQAPLAPAGMTSLVITYTDSTSSSVTVTQQRSRIVNVPKVAADTLLGQTVTIDVNGKMANPNLGWQNSDITATYNDFVVSTKNLVVKDIAANVSYGLSFNAPTEQTVDKQFQFAVTSVTPSITVGSTKFTFKPVTNTAGLVSAKTDLSDAAALAFFDNSRTTYFAGETVSYTQDNVPKVLINNGLTGSFVPYVLNSISNGRAFVPYIVGDTVKKANLANTIFNQKGPQTNETVRFISNDGDSSDPEYIIYEKAVFGKINYIDGTNITIDVLSNGNNPSPVVWQAHSGTYASYTEKVANATIYKDAKAGDYVLYSFPGNKLEVKLATSISGTANVLSGDKKTLTLDDKTYTFSDITGSRDMAATNGISLKKIANGTFDFVTVGSKYTVYTDGKYVTYVEGTAANYNQFCVVTGIGWTFDAFGTPTKLQARVLFADGKTGTYDVTYMKGILIDQTTIYDSITKIWTEVKGQGATFKFRGYGPENWSAGNMPSEYFQPQMVAYRLSSDNSQISLYALPNATDDQGNVAGTSKVVWTNAGINTDYTTVDAGAVKGTAATHYPTSKTPFFASKFIPATNKWESVVYKPTSVTSDLATTTFKFSEVVISPTALSVYIAGHYAYQGSLKDEKSNKVFAYNPTKLGIKQNAPNANSYVDGNLIFNGKVVAVTFKPGISVGNDNAAPSKELAEKAIYEIEFDNAQIKSIDLVANVGKTSGTLLAALATTAAPAPTYESDAASPKLADGTTADGWYKGVLYLAEDSSVFHVWSSSFNATTGTGAPAQAGPPPVAANPWVQGFTATGPYPYQLTDNCEWTAVNLPAGVGTILTDKASIKANFTFAANPAAATAEPTTKCNVVFHINAGKVDSVWVNGGVAGNTDSSASANLQNSGW